MDIVSLVQFIGTIIVEIRNLSETVNHNKNACVRLSQRISGVYECIKHLKNGDTVYSKLLEEVVKILNEAKDFMRKFVKKEDISKIDTSFINLD